MVRQDSTQWNRRFKSKRFQKIRQLGGAWPQYFPWSLPMLVLAKQPENIEAVLLISGAAGLIVAVVGCADFCRREVQ
jgi:hypothetical protein